MIQELIFILDNQSSDYISLIGLLISLASLIISFIALWITYKTFGLKVGDKYKTLGYSPSSSIETTDIYISSITVQNLKDRPLVVFKIFFQLGYNIFIELEDFDKKPLIIKPFEVYQGNYGPILFYSNAGFKKFNLNKLFEDKNISHKIILETIEGEYKKYSILHKFFNNYYTGLLQPFRCFHNEKSFGDKIDYIIDFVYENGNIETLGILKTDLKVIKNIVLNNELLETKEKLEKFLNKNKEKLNVPCKRINVIDWKEKINDRFDFNNLKVVDIDHKPSFFQYYILCKIYTKIQKIKTTIINNQLYKKIKNIKLRKKP